MEFIEVKNLTKKYVSGNIEVTAVDDISFEIKKGEIVGNCWKPVQLVKQHF